MDFFDMVKELRKGTPEVEKTAGAMKIFAWACIIGAIWNFALYYLAPFDDAPFKLAPSFPWVTLISFLFLGALFFYAAERIRRLQANGKKAGQIALVLLFILFVGFGFFMVPLDNFPLDDAVIYAFFGVAFILVATQFGLPVYYGVRYLERLPVREDNLDEAVFKPEESIKVIDDRVDIAEHPVAENQYKDALLPFGVLGTFALFLAVPLLTIFTLAEIVGDKYLPLLMFPTFMLLFAGPISYNFFPSPFQKRYTFEASFITGGSIFLFNGSWPFFRLLVYREGLEVRFMFHRFFIPYDQMEDFPEKVGFFSRGILIKSNLPDVPSGIRIQGFGMKKMIETINRNRNNSTLKNVGSAV